MKPRYHQRVFLKSTVIIRNGALEGEGWVLDLTVPGCLIQSPVTVKKGDYLQLQLFLPGLIARCLVTLAAVRWTKGSQFGVEFIKMPEADREVLNQFVSQRETDAFHGDGGRSHEHASKRDT